MSELERLFGLRGKTAQVTGASSGLGRDCARALARAGADVGLVARRRERLEELASEIAAGGARACAAPADVTVTEELVAAFDRVEAEVAPVDILVSAAGISEVCSASWAGEVPDQSSGSVVPGTHVLLVGTRYCCHCPFWGRAE